MPIRLTKLTAMLLLSIGLGLGACGFQPRGQLPILNQALSPLAVEGVDNFDPLHRELHSALQAAGVELLPSGSKAGSLLRISRRSSDKQVLTTNATNRAVDYELEESLFFTLRRGTQGTQTEPQQVRVQRILYNPGTSLLAKQHEEDTIRREMRQDLVRRLIDRLAALH